MEKITKEIKEVKEFYRIYFKLLSFFRLKILVFYLLIFSVGIFCTYYLFIFCAVYKNIQKELFINYIVGSFWSLGFTVTICLIISIVRILALKKRIKRLYIISTYIDKTF